MFKKRSRPAAVRDKAPAREVISDEEDTESGAATPTTEGQTVEDMVLLRKLRRAHPGIELEKLNRGEHKKKPKTEEDAEQFGLQYRQRTDMDDIEDYARKVKNNNFTHQTNALDVDKHMMAYIEKEMAKRKGEDVAEDDSKEADPQAALYALAERYEVEHKVTEDDEGNMTNSLGMLSAIPEVDLGMENRLKNIEETEKAKREMLERRKEKKEEDDPLAATRFFRGYQKEPDHHREMENAKREAAGLPVRQQRERHKPEMATDEQVYERFKKRMRR